MTQSKNMKAIWAIFVNAPGPEAKDLYEQATRILVSRNLIKAPRTRKPKEQKTNG